MVGRWIGHFSSGRFVHRDITQAPPVRGERIAGWVVHYAIGIVWAALLLVICGARWAEEPSLLPAILTGLVTVVAPFFLLQPGLGLGIAASRTPRPNAARLRTLATHLVFGLGLYVSAVVWSAMTR
jgi:hypothetical protein